MSNERSPLVRHARRVVAGVIGGTLILIALLLIPVPIVPGWPLIIVGLMVLAIEFAWARRLLKRARASRYNPGNWGRKAEDADAVKDTSHP